MALSRGSLGLVISLVVVTSSHPLSISRHTGLCGAMSACCQTWVLWMAEANRRATTKKSMIFPLHRGCVQVGPLPVAMVAFIL